MYSTDFIKLWHKLSKDMKSFMDSQLTPSLTESQLNVLEHLHLQERMKPSDFIEYLETTPAAITTLLDRMEKSGLIVRERDEKDRRIVWVMATEKGQTECQRGLDIRRQFVESHLSKISSHNQQLLVYLLGKVASSA
ncbi:MarR family transcriptional regulator [Paenibacillus aurantius]|uniref:MarR family transcriptional regulator n=1 Tax=Paenibacillus aurantius TaxID=2918900 RepID=A0AA96L9W5_9BACL|nr:MarR family transcriptional regulator [Paenibacillus aurantius]WJH34136.1 MarR family transcriptional regulator [Paenibacillus sp. CC-CFT747]WNQ09214.1 MarR family transcriptional regulator [Paenibacillus aurantius]